MFSYVEPPNEQIRILTKLLKIFCVLTILMGIFRLPAQQYDASCTLYFISSFFYILSWRGLSYYFCLINQVLNVTIVFSLLQQDGDSLAQRHAGFVPLLSGLLQNGLPHLFYHLHLLQFLRLPHLQRTGP